MDEDTQAALAGKYPEQGSPMDPADHPATSVPSPTFANWGPPSSPPIVSKSSERNAIKTKLRNSK